MADTAIVVALALVVAALLAGCGDEHSSDGGPRFVPGSVDVVPRPSEVEVDAEGSQFVLDERTTVAVVRGEAETRAAADLLVELLRGPFPALAGAVEIPRARAQSNAVLLTLAGADAALGRDGYQLTV